MVLTENDIPELDDLAQRLQNIRSEWPWEENIDPNLLDFHPQLKMVAKEGIYNRAVLIVSERSPFTRGLESELKPLAELPTTKYEETALRQWLKW